MDRVSDIVKKLRESRILNERKDYSNYSRDELISMAQQGDQLALEFLMNSHRDLINNTTRKYFLGKDYDEEDMIQIADIGFWEAVMTWDMTGQFDAYVRMIIHRKFKAEMSTVNALKRQSDQSSISSDDPIGGDDEGGELTLGDTFTNNVSAEEQYLGEEGAREIYRFLDQNLSDVERDIIKKYIQGYKVSQIAEETGMKYKSVENAIMRVKNKLAAHMRKSQDESKEMTESLEFTDDEKRVLNSILNKLEERKSIRESSEVQNMKVSYENYTEPQLDREIETIGQEIDDIKYMIEKKEGLYSEEEEAMIFDVLERSKKKLSAMEDYLSDAQYARAEDLHYECSKLEDKEYPTEEFSSDPWQEAGMHQRDFVR